MNLSRHPDYDSSPRISADGKSLVFLSDRDGENWRFDVWGVYLDTELDGLRPYELEEHFKKAADAAKKRKPIKAAALDGPAKRGGGDTLTIDADDAYLRVQRMGSFGSSQSNLAITPGGDRIIFSGSLDGRSQLFSMNYKGEDRKALDSGSVSNVTVSLTGDKVVYVKSGQATSVAPGGGKVETYSIEAPVVVDVAQEQRQKFMEAARILGTRFYHPTLKDLDWVALTERYGSLAVRTRTSDEFNRVVTMLFGELDGSHTGISGGDGYSAPSPATGYLGVDAEPAPGGYRITGVVYGSPAHKRTSRLEVGEVIVSIDGRPVAPSARDLPEVDLLTAMAGTGNRETLLELRAAEGDRTRMVLITPVRASEDSNLRYIHEVMRRRELVERASEGRLGYLHIRGMNAASVRDFERDLYAAAEGKLGLVIDIRANGGGSTADILLSSLTAPRHAYTIPRGADPESVPSEAYPRDRRLIYGYTRPISVLINENSFSNAEIFAHAIKTIGRGKLVGVPTFGGVISTGAATLIDGTRVRTPFRGWYLPDGTDMENNGAQPDVYVEQSPEDEAAGRDAQLEAAVLELLERIGAD